MRLRKQILQDYVKLGLNQASMIESRDYQPLMVRDIGKIWSFSDTAYLALDGGGGKTLIGYLAIQYSKHKKGAIWTAPQCDFIEQADRDFKFFDEQGLRMASPIHTMTIQALYEVATNFCQWDSELNQMIEKDNVELNDHHRTIFKLCESVDILVIDEIHLIGQDSDRMLKTVWHFLKKFCDVKQLLCISATLKNVFKNKPLGSLEGRVATYSGKELEKQGYLNPTMIHQITTGLGLILERINKHINPVNDPETLKLLEEFGIDSVLDLDDDEDKDLIHEEYDSANELSKDLRDRQIEITRSTRTLFRKVNCQDMALHYLNEWNGDKQALFYVPPTDSKANIDYATLTVATINKQMGRKIAYEYHGEIPKDDRNRLKSRFLAGEKMVLVCKDMLVECFSHNPLLLVYYCKLGKNPSTVRMAQAFKRSRRVIRKDGVNIKEMSHAYYGISGANLLRFVSLNGKKVIDLEDLDKFKEFYKVEGEVDPEYQKLLEQGILSLQKLKYDINTEDGAREDQAILEEVQARMRDFDDIAEDLQNQGLGKTIETSTPMYTVVDVNEGHQKKTFEADWYTFYPESKWTKEKAMSKINEMWNTQ